MSGSRSAQPGGLELAELRLLEALRAQEGGAGLDVRVVGGRSACRHARRLGGRWVPSRGQGLPRRASSGADLIHLLGLDLPPPRDTPFVVTIHDLAPLHYDDEGVLPPWLDETVERAALVLTPSAFTAGEINRHLGVPVERIRVIGGAPALEALNAEVLTRRELEELGIESPFVLRTGGYTKRKNVPLILEAWAQVPTGTLVLAGPPQAARAAILDNAISLDRVVVLDYVSDHLLARLLSSASALASTSTYEGFGLPVLEALAARVPVVVTRTAFVEEVCGEAALFVDDAPRALAEGLRRVFVDDELVHRLRAAGQRRAANFTWSGVASEVIRAYESASGSRADFTNAWGRTP